MRSPVLQSNALSASNPSYPRNSALLLSLAGGGGMRHQLGDKQGTVGDQRCLEDCPLAWGDKDSDSQSCWRSTADTTRALMSGYYRADGVGYIQNREAAAMSCVAACRCKVSLIGQGASKGYSYRGKERPVERYFTSKLVPLASSP